MDPHLCVGVDIGYKNHRVGIADSAGQILEEFDIPHTTKGFDHFFHRVEHHRREVGLPVAVAMAVNNKRFLLIKRGIAPRKGSWGSPSGFIEEGETPEEACLRELKEETGISGRILRLADVRRIEDKEIYGDMLVVRYIVAVDDETPVPGDEVEDARFFAIGELPDYFATRFRSLIEEIENEFP